MNAWCFFNWREWSYGYWIFNNNRQQLYDTGPDRIVGGSHLCSGVHRLILHIRVGAASGPYETASPLAADRDCGHRVHPEDRQYPQMDAQRLGSVSESV